MAISSAGIGSGLDVGSIVSRLVDIERQPIRQLQGEATRLQTQISAFGRVQGSFSTLRDAASKLTQASTWSASTATSTDTALLGATATGGLKGNYSVAVSRLAAAQTLATTAFASASTSLGSGTLRIELGDFDSDPPVPKAGATAVELTIDPAKASLTDIRDQINGAGAGVAASIVNDVSGARLVLRSAASGAENGFRVQVMIDDDGDLNDAGGLSALGFDPSAGGVSLMGRTQTAANALAVINGVSVESASNTLDGTIEGLTLNLRKLGQAEVVVEPDTAALKKSVDEFVNAYNESIKLLRQQTSYDPATQTAGPLQGDRSGNTMLTQLRGIFTGSGGISASYSRLADVGLNLNTDGTIKVNATKLTAALANGAELKKLFSNVDTVTPANEGFANKLQGWLNQSLNSDGPLDSRTQSLQARKRNNEQAQARLEDRVARTQLRLERQYSALDTRMGQLSGLAGYVSQQMSLLNNGNNS
ncbi:MAG: flagellar hook protein [Leptothrix sp. (in: Bacteria)]|nr:flagellar hook protein [Leptothrix sp. (in: b-proteobacteria)]